MFFFLTDIWGTYKNIFMPLEKVVHRAWTTHIPKASIRESHELNKHS